MDFCTIMDRYPIYNVIFVYLDIVNDMLCMAIYYDNLGYMLISDLLSNS